MTNFDGEYCRAIADALATAAKDVPLGLIAEPLRKRAREWQRAGDIIDYLDGDGMIAFAGALDAGVDVYDGEGWESLIRVITQGERVSLHVECDRTPSGRYVNLWGGKTSPVVVRS